MNERICPYIYDDCKKSTKCMTNYESCQEGHRKYLADMGRLEIGIGAMTEFNHVVQGRFVGK